MLGVGGVRLAWTGACANAAAANFGLGKPNGKISVWTVFRYRREGTGSLPVYHTEAFRERVGKALWRNVFVSVYLSVGVALRK